MGKGNYWPVKNRVYWCPRSNVPLMGKYCGNRDPAPQLKLTDPGDARPGFQHDRETIRKAYRNEFGSLKGIDKLLGHGVILLNKVPYMDEMKEVVSQGTVVARVYYEPFEGKWRLRLSRPGILRIMDTGIFGLFKVEGGLKVLRHRRKLKAVRENYMEGEQVVLVDGHGEPVGIGYYANGEISVHNVFYTYYPSRFAEDEDSTWDDAVRENEEYLAELEERAIRFIRAMYENRGGPVIVSFSSGKDSLVALHLTLKAGLEPVILFNNTGIELPETVEHVYKIADMWGLKVIESSAGDAFWRSVERVGPPGKDYRWCCKITKLAPLAQTVSKHFPNGGLNIVGQRAYESLDRARSGRVWRNKWLPGLLNISPIQYWGQLAIYLYIFKYNLPLNPLYFKGFDRLGCFMCPAATVAEYQQVKETHPELWSKWTSVLYKWAKRIGLDGKDADLWVEKGVWRWLTPASQKKRLEKRLGIYMPDWREYYTKWLKPFSIIEDREEGVVIRFDGYIDPEFFEDQYSVVGPFTRGNGYRYSLKNTCISVAIDGNRVHIYGLKGRAGREFAYDVVKLYYRWKNCGECKLCETSCPTGAIKIIDGRPIVDTVACIHCKLCIDNCPVSDVTVEKVVIPVNEDEVTAWRRKWKRSRESVIKRYYKLKKEVEGSEVEEEGEEEGFFLGG
ncbi:MAG: phosphoadenosine phosphosulfate reductase family protein [Desulfurococcales archaeon]|nr:phosphoadenosine phosphosulfate reductase family protein [Desulfurococcales archaeon]